MPKLAISEIMIDAGAKAFCEIQSLDPRKLAEAVYAAMREHDETLRGLVEALERIANHEFEHRKIATEALAAAKASGVSR